MVGTNSDPVEQRLKFAIYSGLKITRTLLKTSNFELSELIRDAEINNCNVILIGQTSQISAMELRKLGWDLEQTNIDLVVAPAVTEIAGPRLKVSNVEGLPLLHLEQPSFSGVARFTKRLLDIFITIFGLILISPFLLIVSMFSRHLLRS